MHIEKKVRVLIADDLEIHRIGLKTLLSGHSNYQVVGEVADGEEIPHYLNYKPNIDVILMDVNMPKIDGITATARLQEVNKHIGVIGVSVSNELYRVTGMRRSGAKGYILKNADSSEIFRAINAIHNNRSYYCRETAAVVSDSLIPGPIRDNGALTEKEITIIRLICEEFSNKEIGEKLNLSSRTVEGHRLKILEKLHARNQVGVIKYAIKYGLYILK